MKVGVMADSHGHADRVRSALDVLRAAGAEAIIHCGDVGSLEVLEELAGWRCWFVWGNTDLARASWRRHVEALALPWPEGPLDFRLHQKHIAVYHGHEPGFVADLEAARHDYLFHGHSHLADSYYVGRMHVINPGALHRVSVRTVALVDLAADQVTYLESPR